MCIQREYVMLSIHVTSIIKKINSSKDFIKIVFSNPDEVPYSPQGPSLTLQCSTLGSAGWCSCGVSKRDESVGCERREWPMEPWPQMEPVQHSVYKATGLPDNCGKVCRPNQKRFTYLIADMFLVRWRSRASARSSSSFSWSWICLALSWSPRSSAIACTQRDVWVFGYECVPWLLQQMSLDSHEEPMTDVK